MTNFWGRGEVQIGWLLFPSHRSQQRAHPDQLAFGNSGLDTNLDDLATKVDASEMIDTTDVGRFTSPLFSQEREVSTFPFGVSCSRTHSCIRRPMRTLICSQALGDWCETLSLFQVSRDHC